jgi:glycosyltransferase involved in cell wall biosynthesis
MKILYLCQLIPYPADAGPKVRAYYTLRYLAERHAVTLLAFRRPEDGEEALEHLWGFCEAVHTVHLRRSKFRDAIVLAAAVLSGRSFIIQRDAAAEMERKVNEVIRIGEFDAVHADQLWMAQYALQAEGLNREQPGERPIRLVLDEHNACFQIVERLAVGETNPLKKLILQREVKALRRYEAQAIRRFDFVTTVTEDDRATLQRLACKSGDGKPSFHSIPICVDTGEVQPVTPQAGAHDVLHLGTMFFPPNVEGVLWFARQAWPQVRDQMPEATFTIAGKNPPVEVARMAEGEGRYGGIRVTGYVADPQPYLEQTGVFIVPLFAGSGMRVKIIYAWNQGLPVVSTSVGAEGIGYKDGEDILIADDPESFAEAVIKILQTPALASSLRYNGRQRVAREYNWRSIYKAWDSIYGE